MNIIDISPPVTPDIAVYPGDVPFSRDFVFEFEKGDHLILSSIQTTLHVGAHADAPSHYHPEGESIEAYDLQRYLGPCQVIAVQVEVISAAKYSQNRIDMCASGRLILDSIKACEKGIQHFKERKQNIAEVPYNKSLKYVPPALLAPPDPC